MSPTRSYGQGLPNVDPSELRGRLIVIEGADGSGRSTQIALLTDWLEQNGHAVVNTGLSRSTLVSGELDKAKQGNILGHTTMTLFYATDFADQLENRIIPALKAGFIALADRYTYTLMARAAVRGMSREWINAVYDIALVPDAVFYLKASPRVLVERNFNKNETLDYWESGMDMGLSRDMFESFLKYQRLLQNEFRRLETAYGFRTIDGNRSVRTVFRELKSMVDEVLVDQPSSVAAP